MQECSSCKAKVPLEGAAWCPSCGASLAGLPPEATASTAHGNAPRGITVGENIDQSTKIGTKIEGGIHVSVNLGAQRPEAGRPREFALLPLLILLGSASIFTPLFLVGSIIPAVGIASVAFGSGIVLAAVLISLFAARPQNVGQGSYLAYSIAVLLLALFINLNPRVQTLLSFAAILAFAWSVVALGAGLLPPSEVRGERGQA